MCSLVDLPVMHVLLATRQRAFSLQTPARHATQLAIRYACHTERSNFVAKSSVSLYIFLPHLFSFHSYLLLFLRYTPLAYGSVGMTFCSSVNLYRTTPLWRGFTIQKIKPPLSNGGIIFIFSFLGVTFFFSPVFCNHTLLCSSTLLISTRVTFLFNALAYLVHWTNTSLNLLCDSTVLPS